MLYYKNTHANHDTHTFAMIELEGGGEAGPGEAAAACAAAAGH